MPVVRFVPSTKAPTHPGRFRAATPAVALDSGGPGGEFLNDVFPDGRQSIEVAFGADLTAAPETWAWTDLTTRVFWAPGVTISPMGRPDESSKAPPAGATVIFKNPDDALTLGNAMSQYWPYVKENTPIRMRIDIGNGWSQRFFGYTNGWSPRWDSTRNAALVEVRASGVSRRLKQGDSVPRSSIRRLIELGSPTPIAYWPLEDGPGATSGASALTGQPPLLADGPSDTSGVVFGSALGRVQPPYTGFEIAPVGSLPLASLRQGGRLSGIVPPQSGTPSGYTINFVGRTDAFTGFAGSDVVLFQWLTPGGSFVRWEIIDRSDDGDTDLVAYDSTGAATILANAGLRLIDLYSWRINVNDVGGGNIQVVLRITSSTTSLGEGGILDFTTVAGTLAWPTFVAANATYAVIANDAIAGSENLNNDIVIGHIAIWGVGSGAPVLTTSSVDPITGRHVSAWTGYANESASNRLRRLFTQQGVYLDMIGTSSAAMDIQSVDTFLDLIDRCATADGGLLLDGLNPGFTYICRANGYSQTASLTLTAPGEFDTPVPKHDDFGRVNDYTATQPDGTFGRYVRTDGILGTLDVGTYDSGDQVNLADAADLVQYAAWRTHLGTNGGVRALRYPSLSMQLAKSSTSAVAQDWLDLLPFRRVDAVNMQGSIPTLASMVHGWFEHWNSRQWEVVMNTTPYEPWQFGAYDDARYDCDGSTTNLEHSTSDTSIEINIDDNCIWAHDDGDYDVTCYGEQMTVTAVAGAAADAFGRSVTDGWGAADAGGTYGLGGAGGSVLNSDWQVAAGVGTISVPAANAYRRSHLDSVSFRDVDATITFSSPVTATGAALEPAGFVFRGTTSTSSYLVRVSLETSNAVTVSIYAPSGATLGSATISGLTYSAGLQCKLRAYAVGSTFKAKVWQAASDEPLEWHLVVDDEERLTAGYLGVRSGIAVGNTNAKPVVFSYDNLVLARPQLLTVTRAVNGVSLTLPAGAKLSLTNPSRYGR